MFELKAESSQARLSWSRQNSAAVFPSLSLCCCRNEGPSLFLSRASVPGGLNLWNSCCNISQLHLSWCTFIHLFLLLHKHQRKARLLSALPHLSFTDTIPLQSLDFVNPAAYTHVFKLDSVRVCAFHLHTFQCTMVQFYTNAAKVKKIKNTHSNNF